MPNLTTMEGYGWATEESVGRVRIMSRDSGVGSARRVVWFERTGDVFLPASGTLATDQLAMMDFLVELGQVIFAGLTPVIQTALSPGLTAARNRITAAMRLGQDLTNSSEIR